MAAAPLTLDDLPIIDVAAYLEKRPGWEAECEKVVRCLQLYGILIVKDPRVEESRNETFMDMLEDYFAQEEADKKPDIHPELMFQVRGMHTST